MVERNRVDVLVEDKGDGDREVENIEPFRTESVRQNLDGVGHDKRGEREAVTNVSCGWWQQKCNTYS